MNFYTIFNLNSDSIQSNLVEIELMGRPCVNQVQGEALVELCDESLSANMATTLMKVAKAPPSSYAHMRSTRNTELFASIYELWFCVLLELNNNCILDR